MQVRNHGPELASATPRNRDNFHNDRMSIIRLKYFHTRVWNLEHLKLALFRV